MPDIGRFTPYPSFETAMTVKIVDSQYGPVAVDIETGRVISMNRYYYDPELGECYAEPMLKTAAGSFVPRDMLTPVPSRRIQWE